MSATVLTDLPARPRETDETCNCEEFALEPAEHPGEPVSASLAAASPLGAAPLGFRGRIRALDATGCGRSLPPDELERRLLEMGFVEGAVVEIRNQGLFGRDPIAIRVDNATVALRRAEANAIRVDCLDPVR